MSRIIDIIKRLRSLSSKQKHMLDLVAQYLEPEDISTVTYLLRKDKLSINEEWIKYTFFPKPMHKIVITGKDEAVAFAKDMQELMDTMHAQNIEKEFSKGVLTNFTHLIAPNIIGLDTVKKASALQLFASERFHVLLLGDPGTGKTDVLRSAYELSPIASFGLGSGTSGAGLAVTVKGHDVSEGLLPMADKGICCIDELNLMKEENRAALYNAMEKGFVTYDKGGSHYTFNAKVRILATANPIGDKFKGNDVEHLREQLPFDSALLTRFHLVFIIRKPGLDEFREISRHILRNKKASLSDEETAFAKAYVKKASAIKVTIPSSLEPKIVNFVEDLKQHEKDYLVEISPRLVVGMLNMVKASARMHLRQIAKIDDVEIVLDIIKSSLNLPDAR